MWKMLILVIMLLTIACPVMALDQLIDSYEENDDGVAISISVPVYTFAYAILTSCVTGATGDVFAVFDGDGTLYDMVVVNDVDNEVRLDLSRMIHDVDPGMQLNAHLLKIRSSQQSSDDSILLDGCEPALRLITLEENGQRDSDKSMLGEKREDVSHQDGACVHPNPFNPITTISLGIKYESHVRIDVYDLRGRLVVTLKDGWQQPGHHEYVWDGRSDAGEQMPSGVYFYRAVFGENVRTGKMALMR